MHNKPFLTVGMAHYEDDGIYFAIQDLRLNNPHLMDRVEFVVIDNSPTAIPHADMIKGVLASAGGQVAGTKYVAMPSPVGTSPSRNAIFENASGKYVLAMDCHVLLKPGALDTLFNYFEDNPESSDILSGPLMYDSMNAFSTHYDPVWRSEMFGTWSTAWQCGCGGTTFCLRSNEAANMTEAWSLDFAPHRVDECSKCGKAIPSFVWPRHEMEYIQRGYVDLAQSDGGKAFEIPGQGLGLFACRREAWQKFPEAARGFGGEELCIHEKFRQAGHKALCLPGLKWLHKFGRPNGVKYPIPRWHKIRNYVLWFRELGLDFSPIREHFVGSGLISVAAWDALAQNPEAMEQEPNNSGCSTCGGEPVKPEFNRIEDLYAEVERRPRDLNEHMGTFKKYSSMCDSVTEMTARRESTIAFLCGRPKSVVSYTTEAEGYVFKSVDLVRDTTTWQRKDFVMGSLVNDLQETDLLFIDTKHNYNHLKMELAAYQTRVKRYIILHDTVVYGMVGDDNGPGLMQAVSEFMRENPQWKIVRQHNNQYGLTVLGCRKEDYPQGAGTQLHEMLAELGITPSLTCECNERMTQMNDWGVQGCKEKIDTIIAWLRDGQIRWGWRDRMVAMAKAVTSGIAFKLNPLDPMPGLVNEAIRRAEAKDIAILKASQALPKNPSVAINEMDAMEDAGGAD